MLNDPLANTTGYKMYARGFLGAVLNNSVNANPSPFKEKMMRLTPTFNISQPVPTIAPNHEVQYLYEKLHKELQPLKTAVFRKEIILVAATAFGTINFYSWCIMQLKSPNFGKLHSDFIDDTLNYIKTGERRMSLEAWVNLLNRKETDTSIDNVNALSVTARSFFKPEYSNSMENMLLQDILTLWVSHPNGFEDLVYSMHVFFGKY
jgi:hypothetical protein